MSQEKVDRYKKEKNSRAKQAEQEKLMFRLEMTGAALVLALLVGWFSVSVVKNHSAEKEAAREAVTTTMNVTDMQDYLNGVRESAEE